MTFRTIGTWLAALVVFLLPAVAYLFLRRVEIRERQKSVELARRDRVQWDRRRVELMARRYGLVVGRRFPDLSSSAPGVEPAAPVLPGPAIVLITGSLYNEPDLRVWNQVLDRRLTLRLVLVTAANSDTPPDQGLLLANPRVTHRKVPAGLLEGLGTRGVRTVYALNRDGRIRATTVLAGRTDVKELLALADAAG